MRCLFSARGLVLQQSTRNVNTLGCIAPVGKLSRLFLACYDIITSYPISFSRVTYPTTFTSSPYSYIHTRQKLDGRWCPRLFQHAFAKECAAGS